MKINEVLEAIQPIQSLGNTPDADVELDFSKLTPQQRQQLKAQLDAEDRVDRGSIRPGTAFGLGQHSTTTPGVIGGLASAVAAGSRGDMSYQQAREEPISIAPEGTQFPTTQGTYIKKGSSWVLAIDTNGNAVNKFATPIYSKTLDKAWDKQTQKQLKQNVMTTNALKGQINTNPTPKVKSILNNPNLQQPAQQPAPAQQPVQPKQPVVVATPAPTQPTAQTSQDATKAALAARQAAGLGAYESLDYATFKQRLHEAKTQ